MLWFAGVAQAARHPHEATARPEVTLSDRAKPPPRREAPPPPPTADDLLAVEALLGEVHGEQAAVLRDLIAHTPDTNPTDANDKADYYVRLAELSARTQRTHRLQGAEAEIALGKLVAQAKAGAVSAGDARRKVTLTGEIAAHRAAAGAAVVDVIEVYRALLANPAFASYPHLDTAVFYYAYTLDHAGHRGEALAAYDQLIKGFPGSRFVAEALVALGDAAFEAGKLGDAEARYRKVLQLPSAAAYRYAQYKLGWVVFSQRKFEDALEQFAQVVMATAADPKQQPLNHAATGDLVRAYAEIGRADRALAAFRRIVRKDPFRLLDALGALYLDHGKYDQAIVVYRQLLHDQATDPKVCAWQHAIAQATLVIGKPDDKVHEIEDLVRLYRSVGHALPAADAAECREAAAEMSGQLARTFHQEAVKTQNLETFALADRLYRSYLAGFPDATDHAETEYFRAELGWAGAELERNPRLAPHRWEAVATAFTDVVQAGKLSPKLVQISADAAVQAWMKVLATDAHPGAGTGAGAGAAVAPELATVTERPAPRPLPDQQQRILAAYDLYLTHVPDGQDDERIGVAFLKANLLRSYDHLAEAIPMFEDIVAHHPDHETAEYAAQLVLDSDNRLGRDAALLAFARGLAPAFLTAHPAVATTVRGLQHTAVRREAERLEAEGRRTGSFALYTQCGERYLEIYNADPGAADGDQLLYDAGVCFEAGKALGAAIRVYETLEKLMPASPVAARALARLGTVYETTAQYRAAAEQFERYAGKYAAEANAGHALSDAVQLRKGLGDDPQAISDTEAFVARYGTQRTAEAADALFSLIAIYEKQAELTPDAASLDRVAHQLRAYLQRYATAGGAARRVVAFSKLGDVLWRAACPVATVDGVCARVVRAGPEHAGRAPARPTRCGDDSRTELHAVPRDERGVRAALAAFDHAIAEYEHPAAAAIAGDDPRAALYYYALARFDRAEHGYEQYLAQALPAGLDFDPQRPAIAARSHHRFDAWWTGKQALAVQLSETYQPLTALGDGAIAIAAATRIAALWQNAAAQLYRAEIPANLRTGPFADDASQTYCETLEQVAEPLETTAINYYQGCLATSTKLGWFSAWSRICERELGRLKPAQFPSALELRREPTSAATIIALDAP
ncbi:MAG TPA: tetratricopeptide repeat protein [Kofleriaceae bacterium]|nr:tetratricopeptide repeat protein [Kofleriaceae bacterium]